MSEKYLTFGGIAFENHSIKRFCTGFDFQLKKWFAEVYIDIEDMVVRKVFYTEEQMLEYTKEIRQVVKNLS